MEIFRTIGSILLFLSFTFYTGCSDSSIGKPVQTAGEKIYTKNCKVCHAQAINGAPILGNQKMWGGRAKQGLVTLADHAEQGYGLMPAKGGKEHLTREELELAIIYMISALEKP